MPQVEVNGIELNYEDRGHGPCVVLLHCWLGNLRLWREQLERLSLTHRCIAVDLRGHGGSSHNGDFRPRAMASDVLALLDHPRLAEGRRRPPGAAILIGHSMGGMVAQELALRRPERVRALVLVCSAARIGELGFPRRASFATQQLLRAGLIHRWARPLAAYYPIMHLGTPRARRRCLQREILRVPNAVAWRTLAALREFDVVAELPRIAQPTLVIAGAQDILTALPLARRLAASLPLAHIEILDPCGHMPMLEQPELFNAAIEGFLRGLG